LDSYERRSDIGFVAQELQEVLPELVSAGAEDDERRKGTLLEEGGAPLAISPFGIIPILTKALQELADKVDMLENSNGAN
jgi:hypothetical protein